MADKEYQRKLSAILSADVAGYSLLMRDDEAATVRTITTYRRALTQQIHQYRGRVVDTPGDNILAEFNSVVDAVNCAVEIQRDLAERNAELPENRRMRFRIGINLGDVIAEGPRIYGDGVNITARMEGLAEVGGICISGTVYDAIERKIGLEYEFLGDQEIKNIDKPVRAYRVLSYPGAAAHRVVKAKKAAGKKGRKLTMAAVVVVLVVAAIGPMVWNQYVKPLPLKKASVEKMAFPLPDKPSIAVLPFVNMSGDPDQDYLSDGFTEDLITTISKIPDLFVIARQSSFVYKNKPVKVQQVAEDLGVQYVLEGSIQKSGKQLRVNVQLIDALKGHHVWSERFDRQFKDMFKLKSDILMKIANELLVGLVAGEHMRQIVGDKDDLEPWQTDTLEAWEIYWLAAKYVRRHTKSDNDRARELYQKAFELDPNWYLPLLSIGWTHRNDGRYGWSESRNQSFEKAIEIGNSVLAINQESGAAHNLLGDVFLMKREYEKADSYLEKAVQLTPNSTYVRAERGFSLNYLGKPQDAITHFKLAIRLSPFYPAWYLYHLGVSYHLTGQYEKAIETFKKAIERTPDSVFPHVRLAAVYSELGRDTEARAEAAEVLRIKPEFTIENWFAANPYKDQVLVEDRKALLRKAGLN